MTPEPITTHNRQLLTRVANNTSTFSRYPRVSEQLECLPLETQKLKPFSYNPAINAKNMMVYRYHVSRLATRLAFAQLDDAGRVLANRELQIAGKSVDDPKLWTFNGDQYLSWVEALWNDSDYANTIRCVTKYAKFDGEKVGEIIQPKLSRNDGSEMVKNLVFWDHQGRLMCLFKCYPTHRIYEFANHATDKDPKDVFETEAAFWPYGEIRGGTPPVPYEGKLLRFFHSRLTNEFVGARHRYYIGAYLMNPDPPFEVVRVSRRPVLFGSEIGTVKAKDCPHWKSNVVFASGCVESNGAFVISVGENDSASLLVKVRPEDLNF